MEKFLISEKLYSNIMDFGNYHYWGYFFSIWDFFMNIQDSQNNKGSGRLSL